MKYSGKIFQLLQIVVILEGIHFRSCFSFAVESTTSRGSPNKGDKRLIRTSASEPAKWLSQKEIFSLIKKKKHFIDETNRVYPVVNKNPTASKALPTTLRYEATVRGIFKQLNSARQEKFMKKYTSFYNRYYTSINGVKASKWLLSQVKKTIYSIAYNGKVNVTSVTHSYPQKSIIVRIEGLDLKGNSEIVVLGAHLDSISSSDVKYRAPGADDNGSGCVVLLEALRVILKSGFLPNKTLEFHWYSGEEVGLLGSQDIAESYFKRKVNVMSMVNFDIAGYYVKGKDKIAVYTDYTDPILSNLLRTIITGYLKFTWFDRVCDYGCSDHASWNKFGFPAGFIAEAVDTPFIHTDEDTISHLNFVQILEFTKLAVGYAVEVSEPV